MRHRSEGVPPSSLPELKSMIASRQLVFPDRFERVIRRALVTPELIAFGSSNSVALACSVSPTTVVRLAGFLGFENYRDLRTLFREHLRRRAARVPASGSATGLAG
ncbi:transcriptional regulator [Sinorhizobium meliloti]|uniref:Transcriptional regulator n=1 Tax=Rhizobium meliloti TaxID=382 RepID=A0A6A7ZYQ9_RHIML|nr:transcriptional regulator [Sinorhizobium meliloti]MDW9607011.1 transcriptional regulator [Sinorhizobium meliloti]MDW9626740.1 transcriptional regulator [Sinorhizobium meliloti]MDW9674716.1 transcriptional regulator [Sinorhizobium meliloti]MDW9828824.1 transcriptional regulator [Sinorhizobium meliloti]